jgi:pimeloyl-ACP methyl ester carboxylesterase
VHNSGRRRIWPVWIGVFFAAVLGLALAAFHRDLPLETLKARYAGPPSKFTQLGEMVVHYRDEGTGPALVLLHGTGASLHTWDEWASELRNDFRVIRMDLPGFGLTGPEPNEDYSAGAYVRFIDSFVSQRGLSRFDLAGNSLGGFLAWRYAVAHPGRVRKLILVDAAGYPQARPPPLVFRLARIPVLSSVSTRFDPHWFVEKTLRQSYGDPSHLSKELVNRYAELALRPGNRQAFVARVSTREPDSSGEIRLVRAPTLILWGALDVLIDPRDAARFHTEIQGSRLIVYPGVGHVPMEEIGHRTAVDVKTFLLHQESMRR